VNEWNTQVAKSAPTIIILIALLFIGIAFGSGLAIGIGHKSGITDTELDRIRTELAAERQRIIELEGTVTELASRNNQLTESLSRASEIAGEIDQSIGRIETIQGNMAEKLRGIITALTDIQRALRSFNDSINIGGSGGDS
jgi:hypothetical protein